MPGDHAPPPQDDLAEAWRAVVVEVRREVTDFTFHIWLEPLAPAGRLEGTLYVRAPDHIRTWVEDSFLPLLRRAARVAIGASAVWKTLQHRYRSRAATGGINQGVGKVAVSRR